MKGKWVFSPKDAADTSGRGALKMPLHNIKDKEPEFSKSRVALPEHEKLVLSPQLTDATDSIKSGTDIGAVRLQNQSGASKIKAKRRGRIINVLMVISVLLLVAGAALLIYYLVNVNTARQSITSLRDMRLSNMQIENHAANPLEEKPWQQALMDANFETKKKNNDFAAWVSIANTSIDYPVMFTPKDMEYYLRRSFEKQSSIAGVPFLNAACDLTQNTDNVVVYGHNLQSGDMFAGLLKYKDQSFWEQHKKIVFSTPSNVYEYEIIAVFSTVLDDNNPATFHYDHFINAATEQEFDKFVQKAQSLAYYDTGITAQYGDKLLTLSTCATSYNSNGARTVVVAKRVSEYPV